MNRFSSRPRGGFFFAILALLGSLVTAQAATLLPNGKQTFINANGAPLALGTVTMYVPGTTTAKTTWQDSAQTILNTNPITLGIDGTALIYGSGCYRQIVKDSSGTTIWDQPTCDVSSTSLIWAGHSSGTANSQTLTASNFSSQDGQTISFIAGQTNTAAFGLVVNGGSPINVLKDTAGGPFSLAGGEVQSNNLVQVVYDATRGAFHLVNNPFVGANPESILSGSGTTDLGSASSHLVLISGNATIASFGSSANVNFPSYTLIFTGTSTLVNSANLVLPGYRNITTANLDVAEAIYTGPGSWFVYAYFPRSGATLRPNPAFANVVSCPWTVPTDLGANLPTRIDVQIAGGGGGGGGNGTDGGAGGATTFNAITASGGAGGTHSPNNFGTDGGAGGTGGAGSASLRVTGQSGGGGVASEGGGGGTGAAGGLGGLGGKAAAYWSIPGSPSPANTAARMNATNGGGGGGWTSGAIGSGGSSGGGGGEYAEFTIIPSATTIACALGAGGTAGTSAGTGGSGVILTRSYFD